MEYHIGETPARGGGKPHPDRDQWMDYQWPSTRLTSEDMRRLHLLRMETKKPITQLIHEAVELMYEMLHEKKAD